MKKFVAITFLFLLILNINLPAQSDNKKLAVSAGWNYTTTSKLYLQPNSPDLVLKNTYQSMDDIFNYSAELRYQFWESVSAGIGSEFVRSKSVNSSYNLAGTKAVLTEGYELIPLELTFYYQLPISTERFKFFMGGGAGIYFGKHIREIGDAKFEAVKMNPGYGIHVLTGMDFFINDYLSVRAQMRFRDPEFKMESRYNKRTVDINGRSIALATQAISSKVNVDGITFSFGVTYNFNLPF
jgi:outer membrane protein W